MISSNSASKRVISLSVVLALVVSLLSFFVTPAVAVPPSPPCVTKTTKVGNDTVVQFLRTGTCTWNVPADVTQLRGLIVGGGGGGGGQGLFGGGGGGGGYVEFDSLLLSDQTVTITVGAGGQSDLNPNFGQSPGASSGENSSIVGDGLNITALGGGAGGASLQPNFETGSLARDGGSGGGSGLRNLSDGSIDLSYGQATIASDLVLPGGQTDVTINLEEKGNDGSPICAIIGGISIQYPSSAGGGGGAGGPGICEFNQSGASVSHGGDGYQNDILGVNHYWAGGGGGGNFGYQTSIYSGGDGGLGGGGGGGAFGEQVNPQPISGIDGGSGLNLPTKRNNFQYSSEYPNAYGSDGGVNTGGGGGGGTHPLGLGGNGGSGIVVLRYLTPQGTPDPSSDATLGSATVKGIERIELGGGDTGIPASASAVFTLSAAEAAGSESTFFTPSSANIPSVPEATVRAVLLTSNDNILNNFNSGQEYNGQAISPNSFFIVKVTAQDGVTNRFYRFDVEIDATAPLLVSSTPADGDVDVETILDIPGGLDIWFNLRLVFDEPVKWNPDKPVKLYRVGNSGAFPDEHLTLKSGDGSNTLVFYHTEQTAPGLLQSSEYEVVIDSDSITDLVGNSFEGIARPSSIRFTTKPGPVVISRTPGGSSSAPLNSDFSITFNEPVSLVEGKSVHLYREGFEAPVYSFPVTGLSNIDDKSFTQSLDTYLVLGASYYILIDPEAFLDLTGNLFNGFSSPTDFAFTTARTVPGAPTSVSVTRINPTIADVLFVAPTFDGRSEITEYSAISSPDGIIRSVAGEARTIRFENLNPVENYTFTVVATNDEGDSESSLASNTLVGNAYNVPCSTNGGFITISINIVIGSSSERCEGTLVIPEGVTEIATSALEEQVLITGLSLPSTLVTIGNDAFAGATALTELVIPNNVSTIGSYAFTNAMSLRNLTIGNSVVTIGDGAFWYANLLTSIVIPDSVETIGVEAFARASDGNILTLLRIGRNVINLGDEAFSEYDENHVASFQYCGTDLEPEDFGLAGLGGVPQVGCPPEAPTSIIAISAGATSIDVSFTAPSENGGSPVTSYTAISSPGGISGSISQAGNGTIRVSGLTAGISYTFTVIATNSVGNSLPSLASNLVSSVRSPSAPSSVVAVATGKRSARITLINTASDGGAAITSYSLTSSAGGISRTFLVSGNSGSTFTHEFTNLQPGTTYTFLVTATNSVGTSPVTSSNVITTVSLVVASITSLTYSDDGTGSAGKLIWTGKNIDSVLFTGPSDSYPGPFNYGAFTSRWNGTIRNLTPETTYTITIFAASEDGVGESKSLTFTTGIKTAEIKDLAYWNSWLKANTFMPNEAANLISLLNKFNALVTSRHRSFIKVPISRVSSVSARSLTPMACSVVSTTAKVDAGLVKALTRDTCTISYTVLGPSRAAATLVKDFVFNKVG